MKIIVPPIYERRIDSLKEDKDFFKRKNFSDNLTRLFLNSDNGMVVSIDAKWGDGKTTFVRNWVERLGSESQLIPIYYDAYKSDFTSDAFLSIAAAIQKNLPESKIKNRSAELWSGLVDSTIKVAQDSIKLGVGLAVTNLTAGIVNGREIFDNAGDAVGEALSGAIAYEAKERLDTHLKAEENIEHYKKALDKILKSSEGGKKIVFFIDELDRCRPDFSMQVIEKLKHLFSVESVIFVLVINKEQLTRSVMHAYGVDGKDAGLYLQKFIHIETKLPSIDHAFSNGVVGLDDYLDSLLDAHGMPSDALNYGKESFCVLIGRECLDMNPRAIERAFVLVAMVIMTMEPDGRANVDYLLVFFSSAIKVGFSKFYAQYKSGRIPISIGDSGPRDLEHKCGDILNSTFSRYVQKKAANVVVLDEVVDICNRIDLFIKF
jgi:hypothetical protein